MLISMLDGENWIVHEMTHFKVQQFQSLSFIVACCLQDLREYSRFQFLHGNLVRSPVQQELPRLQDTLKGSNISATRDLD